MWKGIMAETPSTMLPLGTPVPEFSLTDAVTGDTITPADAVNPADPLRIHWPRARSGLATNDGPVDTGQ